VTITPIANLGPDVETVDKKTWGAGDGWVVLADDPQAATIIPAAAASAQILALRRTIMT
jgi:hypothetical protein